MKSGIYQIEHRKSGRRYVGSAVDIAARWRGHRNHLRRNTHHSRRLQNAWNKHGHEAFVFSVLEHVEEPMNLLTREQYWIDLLGACKTGYNISPTAGSQLGVKRSAESRARMSAGQTGLRRIFSEEHKQNLSRSAMGRTPSDATRRKMSIKAAERGAPSLTREQIDRGAAKRRGAKRTPEQIARIRAGQVAARESRAAA